MKKRNNILKEAGVLIIATLLVLTTIVIVPMTTAQMPHDVGVDSIDSPTGDGPAQEFPVKVTIKNYGQNQESCFKTHIKIAEVDIWNQMELLTEDFYPYYSFPPTGWIRTSTKWLGRYSNYCGAGDNAEACFDTSPSETGVFRLYTSINTLGYGAVEIRFKHFVNHDITTYKLQVETSADGINWESVWEIEPTNDLGPETISILTGENVGSTTYFSWTFNGDSENIDSWYVDDIIIYGFPLFDPEYTEEICTDIIEVGEEIQLTQSPNWAPEFLQEEITGTKIYSVKACTDLQDPMDNKPSNDCETEILTLDFWHDVAVSCISTCQVLGDQDIEAVVENLGTFPELGLTASAEIYPPSGPTEYRYIYGINLDESLGGTETLNFGSYNFAVEGTYQIKVSILLAVDDKPINNVLTVNVEIIDLVPLIEDLIEYVTTELTYVEEPHFGNLMDKLVKAKEKIDADPPDIEATKDNLESFREKVNADGYGVDEGDRIILNTDVDLIIAILENCG